MTPRLPDAPAVVKWLFWAGVALVLGTSALGEGWGMLLFGLWALLPWVALRAMPLWLRDPWPTSAAAVALLLGEMWVRAQVFLFPTSSTAAILLVFSPALLLFAAIPIGLVAGFSLGTIWKRTRVVGRSVVVSLGVVLAGLVAIAAVAPGWLPTPLARAVSAKERIGPPRVIAGEGWLRRTPLSDRSSWYLVGDFDGAPGDEIAEVGEGAVILRDPDGFGEKSRLALSAEARARWSWSSRLVRDGDELLVADQGGGFQDVGLWDLQGKTRWGFRPDATLPPIAMLPADLDRDGRAEFYAASGETVYRLDGGGRVSASVRVPGGVDSLDVGAGAEGGRVTGTKLGRPAQLWDGALKPLSGVEVPRKEYRYQFVDWPEPVCLVAGPGVVSVVDPTGRVRLQHDLGDFAFSEAAAVSWEGTDYLAVLAAGPRDLGVFRLVVFDSRGAVVYDEVLPKGGRLLVARGAEPKNARLFLASDGLVAYDRPVASRAPSAQ